MSLIREFAPWFFLFLPLLAQAQGEKKCGTDASQLAKYIEDWSNKTGLRVIDDKSGFWSAMGLQQDTDPLDTTKRLVLGFHLYFEDGHTPTKPLRSGYEVDLYKKIKDFISKHPGEKLDQEKILQMGLEASARDGKVNLQLALFTIYDVIRILARPDQWSADSQEGHRGPDEIGHPADDPIYPILQDLRGIKSLEGSGDRSLAEIRNVARHQPGGGLSPFVPGESIEPSWTMGLFDPKNGVFPVLPGAKDSVINGGNSYYFWLGSVARTTLGYGGVLIGAIREQIAKNAGGASERGAIQIAQFRCGSDLGGEVVNTDSFARGDVCSLTPEQAEELRRKREAWLKALNCIRQGVKQHNGSWIDCNGNWMMRSPDIEIPNLERLLQESDDCLNRSDATRTAQELIDQFDRMQNEVWLDKYLPGFPIIIGRALTRLEKDQGRSEEIARLKYLQSIDTWEGPMIGAVARSFNTTEERISRISAIINGKYRGLAYEALGALYASAYDQFPGLLDKGDTQSRMRQQGSGLVGKYSRASEAMSGRDGRPSAQFLRGDKEFSFLYTDQAFKEETERDLSAAKKGADEVLLPELKRLDDIQARLLKARRALEQVENWEKKYDFEITSLSATKKKAKVDDDLKQLEERRKSYLAVSKDPLENRVSELKLWIEECRRARQHLMGQARDLCSGVGKSFDALEMSAQSFFIGYKKMEHFKSLKQPDRDLYLQIVERLKIGDEFADPVNRDLRAFYKTVAEAAAQKQLPPALIRAGCGQGLLGDPGEAVLSMKIPVDAPVRVKDAQAMAKGFPALLKYVREHVPPEENADDSGDGGTIGGGGGTQVGLAMDQSASLVQWRIEGPDADHATPRYAADPQYVTFTLRNAANSQVLAVDCASKDIPDCASKSKPQGHCVTPKIADKEPGKGMCYLYFDYNPLIPEKYGIKPAVFTACELAHPDNCKSARISFRAVDGSVDTGDKLITETEVREFYGNFAKSYMNSDLSALLRAISPDWNSSTGASLFDVSNNLRRAFSIYRHIKFQVTNLAVAPAPLLTKDASHVPPADPETMRVTYHLVITGELVRRSGVINTEESDLTEWVGRKKDGTLAILRTVGSWQIQ